MRRNEHDGRARVSLRALRTEPSAIILRPVQVAEQLGACIEAAAPDTVNALAQAGLATGALAREILDEVLLPGTEVVVVAAREHERRIIGTSAVLKEGGLRDSATVMVDGAPVTAANARMAVQRAKALARGIPPWDQALAQEAGVCT